MVSLSHMEILCSWPAGAVAISQLSVHMACITQPPSLRFAPTDVVQATFPRKNLAHLSVHLLGLEANLSIVSSL